METPQIDGNPENQEKTDKKIIGRGFRPDLKTPKNFPYPLELNNKDDYLELDFDEKRNRLSIGGDSRLSKAFVEVHPKGLLLMIDQKKYIIPGELGLAKTVDLLSKQHTTIKEIYRDSDINKKIINYLYENYSDIEDLAQDAEAVIKSSALRHRKREIAGALLANDLWQKRGFLDKKKVAPKNFWQVVPVEELILGDKRNLKRWWEDALSRTLMDLPGRENYGLELYKDKYDLDVEIIGLRRNHDHLTEEEYSEKEKSYRMYGIIKRNALLKPIRDKIKEGFFPESPWEIRHWDKIPFESLKKSLLYGLHKMPEWEAYIKSGAPQIESILHDLRSNIIINNIYSENNTQNIEQKIEKYDENNFFQPLKQEIKERIHRNLALFTEGKILEGEYILINKIQNKENPKEKTIKKLEEIIEEKKKNIIGIFENNRKNQFIVPDFACIDGWEWDKNETSFLALKILEKQRKKYDFALNKISNTTNLILKEICAGRFLEITEKDEENLTGLLKCIAIKNENGIQKEAILGIDSYSGNWYAMGYQNCDLTDLRKVKIFCRTLDAIKKELKLKNSKEKVIGNPLFLNSINQLNQTGGR